MAVPVARTRAALAGCDDGGPGFVNAGSAGGHQRATSLDADANKMRMHTSTCSRSCKQHPQGNGTDRSMGAPSCLSKGRAIEGG